MKKKQQQHGDGECPAPRPPAAAAAAGGGPGQGGGLMRRRPLSLLPFLSLRDYVFCMATLLLFCLGSLFYQLNGGPPHFLLALRHCLGKGGRRRRGLVAAGLGPPSAPGPRPRGWGGRRCRAGWAGGTRCRERSHRSGTGRRAPGAERGARPATSSCCRKQSHRDFLSTGAGSLCARWP